MKILLLSLKNSQCVRALQLLHSSDSNVDLQLLRFQDNLKGYVETFQEEVQKQRLNKMVPREAMFTRFKSWVHYTRHDFSHLKNFYIKFRVISATSQSH